MTHTLQQVTLEAKVIRADGTVEDLGTIASWHRDPEQREADHDRGIGRIHTKEDTDA